VADAIRAETSKPAHVVPLPVETLQRSGLTRADVGLPDGFAFLFCFDFLSVVERKNSHGLVEAFERAFASGDGPTLVIKTINGEKRAADLAVLERRTAHRDDIVVVDGYRSPEERDVLVALCDCYVSLHRSEGYGLTMAEAMAAATPVIATAYSGNLAFMDEENSLLVPYRMTRIPPGCDPYPAGAEWAEPDLDAAAKLMRYVYENQEEARALGRRAQEDILRRGSPLQTGRFVAGRLDDVRAERAARVDSPSRATDYPGSALLGAGSRGPVRLARGLLQRLLWPYLERQRAFDTAVADALRAHTTLARDDHAPVEPGPAIPRPGQPRGVARARAVRAVEVPAEPPGSGD